MASNGDTPAADKAEKPEPSDDLVSSQHTLTSPGHEDLHYTATTGRIVLREEEHTDDVFDGHKAKAELSFTSYVVDGGGTDRPVTFAFNGGPGSASVWLHLGLLGPRKVVMGDVGALLPPPYGLADNHETLLRDSDLVFIDPVSTGYSRVAEGGKPKDYHGYLKDVEYISEVIRLWVTRNNRWLSPKFLCGESYGTLRAAAVAEHLQSRYGMYLNGLAMVSLTLDLGSIDFTDHNDVPYVMYLPTYAAIAHYHGLHGDRPLADVVAEAEAYAAKDYPWVLQRGNRLTAEERAEAVATVARLTGLSEDYVDRVDLRVEHIRFSSELLRHKRLVVGRLDGRFTGEDTDYGREHWTADPSMSAIVGPYTAALNHYLRAELNYENDLPYEVLSRRVHPWSYKEFEGRNISVADKLAAAMRTNPALRVQVACGYHDAATPHFAAEYTMNRLAIGPELYANIEYKYYEAGHMMYVHEESRLRQSADIAAFVRGER